MRLKEKIFGLFSPIDKASDTYKDENGQGILERFNVLVAEDMDETVLPGIENLLDNLTDPQGRFFAFQEDQLGLPVLLPEARYPRGLLVRLALRINFLRGTKTGYEMLLGLAGFHGVTIIEHDDIYGFDHDTATFDHEIRKFDTGCPSCTEYSLELLTDLPHTLELENTVMRCVAYLEPINAKLRSVTINGEELIDTLAAWIDVNGDFIYNNDAAPDMEMQLDNGDLIVEGPDANNYSMDANGNLIYK